MTNFELPPNDSPDFPYERERFLIEQVLQNTTLAWREALRLEEIEGGYLQGFAVEAGEPTVAFRMDSKREFQTKEGPRQHKLYIHTPENSDPEQFLSRIWVKHVRPDRIEAMYTVSHEQGVQITDRGPFEAAAVAQNLEEEIESFSSDVERDRITRINNLLRLFHHNFINKNLIIVKFYS